MLKRALLLARFLAVIALPRPAWAIVEDVNFSPTSAWWEWENPPMAGHVGRIIETTQVPSGGNGKLSKSFECEYRFAYRDGRRVSKTQSHVGSAEPLYTLTFDAQGRPAQLIWMASEYPSPQMITTTESAHYDADRLQSFVIERSDGKKIEVPVETTAAADGGKTLDWHYTRPKRDEHYTLEYDRSGHLKHAMLEINGMKMTDGPALTYNDRGDVTLSESISGKSRRSYSYEYEYDPQGNWTRRTEYQVPTDGGAQTKRIRQVLERKITYGGIEQQSPSSPAAPSTKPEFATLAGSYTAQQGDPATGGFYSIMQLQLKSDGTALLTNTMPDIAHRGEKIINRAEGSWSIGAEIVTVMLEKGNGHPIPPDDPQRLLKFTPTDGGKRLTTAQGPEFKRE